MRNQVAMSKANGELVIAIPLFRNRYSQKIENLNGYSVSLFGDEPIAYAIEHPEIGIILFNAEFVHSNMEFLGDLEDEEPTDKGE